MGHQWIHDLRITLPSLIAHRQTPDGMAEVWRAASYSMKRDSQRIRKMRLALPLVTTAALVVVALPLISGSNPSILEALSRLGSSMLVLLFIWRLTVRSSIRQAHNVHQWAVETLREPDLFLVHPADATAINAPWVDLDSKLISKAKTALHNRIRP